MISYLFVYLSDGFPSLPCFLFANVHRVFVAPSLLKILVSQRERTCSRALLMFTPIRLLDTCSSLLFRCHAGFFRLVPWLRFPLASVLTLNIFPSRAWNARHVFCASAGITVNDSLQDSVARFDSLGRVLALSFHARVATSSF